MRWTIKPKPPAEAVKRLTNELNVDPVIASLLLQRGISNYDEAKAFFRPDLDDLHDPFQMKDMDLAVKRIHKAISDRENIMVYGDYDVDGTTSVALVSTFLKERYPNVCTYIPDRYAEGYGISYQGIDFAEDNNISLIIALDCGIKAVDKVEYAKEKGIDFIICDHHRPGDKLPEAFAVLDPKRSDCKYPYKELCGCGVGFKLIQAFAQLEGSGTVELLPYLDLVVTAIAADIVPMTGENRVLAYFGLRVLNADPRPGIKALLNNLDKSNFTITDVVFIIAPRINAAGRMKHGNHAVELLCEEDFQTALEFAADIESYNTDRRNADKQITVEALDQIEASGEQERYTTVVYDPSWHKGVIGIVASRLIETYYRPTIVFTKSGEKLAASARSVKGFDIYNALEACSEHLEQFGGHKYAAGLTLTEDQYPQFKEAFEKVVTETIEPRFLKPELQVDAQIEFEKISPKFYRILKQFAPFGPGNMTPVFMSSEVMDNGDGRCVGEDKTHLRLVLQQNGRQFASIGFGLGDKKDIACTKKPIQVAYTIDENEWQGRTSLQLKLRDVKA